MTGIFSGAHNKKMAHPLAMALRGTGLGAIEYCPSPCTTVDPEVKRYQSMMNVDLKRMNYNQIGVDGKLGKGTCGLSMFFSQVPQLFQTARAGWDDDLAFAVYKACNGKPFALPTPVSKKDSVFVDNKDDPVCKKESPAWGTVTDKVKGNANQLNTQLAELGYESIPVSGELNATFCGAAKLVDALNNTQYLCNPGFNCQSFVAPKKKVSSPVPVATPTPVSTAPVPTSVPTAPTTKQASMATTGLLVGLGAAGLYLVGKHYSWF